MKLRYLTPVAAALLLTGCSSDDPAPTPEPTPGTPTSEAPSTPRGATQAGVGEPVERADGAYTITLTDLTEPADCGTYGEDRDPADEGGKLVIATFEFETSDYPLPSQYLMPLEFYTVTGDRVASVPNIGGEYSCTDGVKGRQDLAQPFSNTSYERVETFMVPVDAEWLGYRDPDTRQVFEWSING